MAHLLTAAFGASQVTWHHVYAHRGDLYNELVDELAKYGSTLPLTSRDILSWLESPEDLLSLQWLWLLVPCTRHHPAYPILHGDDLLHFRSKRPTVEAPPQEPCAPPVDRSVKLPLRIASANILTIEESRDDLALHPGSRQQLLMAQFLASGFHLIALQETRHRQAFLPSTPDFAVIGHPADSQGFGGLQLWLNLRAPLGPGIRPLRLADCTIVESHPEWLICKIRHSSLRCVVVVAHGPHSERGHPRCCDFWEQISKCLRAKCRHWKVIFAGDPNAHLGSAISEAVGPHQAEEENVAGAVFHDWLLQQGLWAPSTFESCHEGDGATFLHPGQDHWRRLDFICLDQALPVGSVKSWVETSIDISLKRTDHLVVACECEVLCLRAQPSATLRTPQRHAIKRWLVEEETSGFLRSSLTLPSPQIDVHTHAELLSRNIVNSVNAKVPKSTMRPFKRTLTDSTWQLLQTKQLYRKRFFRLRQQCQRDDQDPTAPSLSFLYAEIQACTFMMRWYGSLVKAATRADDRTFFQGLADEAGKVDSEGGLQRLWKRIRYVLPKHKAKRRGAGYDLHSKLLKHFEQLEAGTTMDFSEAWKECLLRQERTQSSVETLLPLSELPTLFELEQLCRKQTPGKAPGLDGILPDLAHGAPNVMAVPLHLLLMKSPVNSEEPFQFKGGKLVALHKRNGSYLQADRYRGILLSSTLAKISHAWLRARLLPVFQQIRSPGQLGGRPHQQTSVAMHTLRLHARRARSTRTSTAILFIDLRSAYHHLLRELVFAVQEPMLREELSMIFSEDTFDVPALAHRLHQCSEANRDKIPAALCNLLADVHQNTWFMLKDSDGQTGQCTMTKRGTRPGSPLADIGFGLLLAQIVNRLEAYLDQQEDFVAGCDRLGCRTPIVVWADDIAICLATTSPSLLEPLLARVTGEVWDQLRASGLSLNLEAKKTEAVLMFRGPGAVEARLRLFRNDNIPKLVVPCQDHIITLQLSATYKHLGGRYGMSGDLQTELLYRQREARRAFAELRRPLFGNQKVSVRTRLQLLQSLVLTKLLYGAAVWADLSDAQMIYMQWVRSITRRFSWDATDRTSDARLRAEFHLPTIRLILAKMRLRYLHFVVHWADAWYVNLLLLDGSAEGSWLQALGVDFSWLTTVVAVPQPLQDAFSQGWPAFFAEVRNHPSWGALINKAFLRSIWQETVAVHTFSLHQSIFDTLTQFGVSWEDPSQQGTAPVADEFLPCPHCSEVFATRQHLGAHLFSAHGIHSDERNLVLSTTCRGCLKDFRTTARVVQHLKYRGNGCFAKLFGVCTPQHGDAITLPEDLQHVRRLPCVRRLFGPLRPTPAERHRSTILTELYWLRLEEHAYLHPFEPPRCDVCLQAFEQIAQVFLEPADRFPERSLDDWLELFVDTTLSAHAHPGDGVDVGCVLWLECHLAEPPSSDVASRLAHIVAFWAADLPLWSLRQRIGTLLTSLDLPPVEDQEVLPLQRHARPRGRDLLHLQFGRLEAWELSQRECVLTHWPAPCRPLECDFLVYVHLYSGRRRAGDVHQFLEENLQGRPGSHCVLSLDTAVNPALNIWDNRLWSFLRQLAASGRLAALLLGPPCETWTAARHRRLTDEWGNILRGPRPLRGRGRPWGLDALGVSELKQIDVGTTLLLRGLHLAVLTALHGGVVLGEHPRAADDPEVPSIWCTALMQLLISEASPFFLTHLEQWQFGSRSVKPTTILTAFTDLDFWLRQMRCTWVVRPQYALIGKERSGEYRTASAKEYPLHLNRAFAAAMSASTAEVGTGDPDASLWQLAQEFESMCQTFQSSWQPDYQPV
eukprot:Skav226797  [mRNA]  locus=scaffold8:603244:608673:- [translate_table: standard]